MIIATKIVFVLRVGYLYAIALLIQKQPNAVDVEQRISQAKNSDLFLVDNHFLAQQPELDGSWKVDGSVSENR